MGWWWVAFGQQMSDYENLTIGMMSLEHCEGLSNPSAFLNDFRLFCLWITDDKITCNKFCLVYCHWTTLRHVRMTSPEAFTVAETWPRSALLCSESPKEVIFRISRLLAWL